MDPGVLRELPTLGVVDLDPQQETGTGQPATRPIRLRGPIGWGPLVSRLSGRLPEWWVDRVVAPDEDGGSE